MYKIVDLIVKNSFILKFQSFSFTSVSVCAECKKNKKKKIFLPTWFVTKVSRTVICFGCLMSLAR